jgi:predicted ATPase
MSSKGVDSRSEITLGPLELDDMRELISSILAIPNDDKIDEYICTHIYQKTGGLPVYVIELLETVKRNDSYFHDSEGKLRLSIKDSQVGEECSALVLSQMLNRFDALGAQVRKVLHTCAILGNSFSLFDLARVHPELDFHSVEDALNVAVAEMILFELGEDDDKSAFSASSTGGSHSKPGSSSVEFSRTSSRIDVEGERNFEFSHDMWRTTVLATLLEARKIELHRRIAIAMEKENATDTLERNDPSRLLALFEHWKSCGDFLKAAPLALTVGSKLYEWDLLHQSMDLYHDALEMSLRSVQPVEKHWVQSQGTLHPFSSLPPCGRIRYFR